jgi:1,4-dihydroxy-2-naphthoyl-CoA hydrolase
MHRFERSVLRSSPSSSFEFRQTVRFQDVDAAGLLFFARYFDLVHDAYVVFLEKMGEPLARVLSERTWAAPLRHVECDYVAPLRFGDAVVVRLVTAHLEPTEIALGFRLETEGERVVALAQTVHTFVDLGSFERRDVPERITSALSLLASRE